MCPVTFKSVKAVINSEDGSIIVLWAGSFEKNDWFRIFIDGYYCGVDRFDADQCNDDMDDFTSVKDLSLSFIDRVIVSACVEADKKKPNDLTLVFRLKNGFHRLYFDPETHLCRFEQGLS